MYQVKLEKFEGPLDLLLQLIEEQEMDITQVSLAQVADQFIAYLNQAQGWKTEDLADFLVIAAKLLYIKSKALLPTLDIAGEEDAQDLEKQLKLYKEYSEASKTVHRLILKKRFCFVRERMIKSEEIIFNPPKNLVVAKLKTLFEEILSDLQPIFELPKKAMLKTISIQEKIHYIRDFILSCIEDKLCFHNLLKDVKSKTEVIVSFLALLELVKQKYVVVDQEEMFKDITIKKYEPKVTN